MTKLIYCLVIRKIVVGTHCKSYTFWFGGGSLPPQKFFWKVLFLAASGFFLIFVIALSLDQAAKRISTKFEHKVYAGVKWIGHYRKWASSMAWCGRHLEKTLLQQVNMNKMNEYMNIKQLLQLECIALQHIIIILLWTYLFMYYKVNTNWD